MGERRYFTNDENPQIGVPILIDDKDEDDVFKNGESNECVLPLLAARNVVLFPNSMVPLNVSRDKSARLLKDMYRKKGDIVVVAQKDATVEDPSQDELYSVGTVARVLKILKLPDGGMNVLIKGKTKVRIETIEKAEPYDMAKVVRLDEEPIADSEKKEFRAACGLIKDMTIRLIQENTGSQEMLFVVKNYEPDAQLINWVLSCMEFGVTFKQEMLELSSLMERAKMLVELLTKELQFYDIKNEIRNKAQDGINRQQREYMLHLQMKQIQNELGDDPNTKALEEIKSKAFEKLWNLNVRSHFNKELARLESINTNSAEYGMQLSYVQALLDLPWNYCSQDNFNLTRAAKCLDSDHFGLEKVKERILEHLAVLKLKGTMNAPILCLYGPPGVGKTSLGKSIAEALGRQYVRMSLGGLHDESEIRGHRRTYVGAMPGRILQNLKKATTSNPVFILDEIDKVSSDFHGDPASALLEVLDPEQNFAFHDNYIDVDYDLSQVFFIATANDINTISRPLLDRMELINVSGYVMEEKVEIALRHLLPRQKKNNGLDSKSFSINKKLMSYIVDNYTRESGVRQLDKVLAKICRKVALKIAKNEEMNTALTQKAVVEMLGRETVSHDMWEADMPAGVVTGLAWTAVGGEILFVETSVSKGKGKVTLTGKLGDVMKESAILAVEYVRANANRWGLEKIDFDEENFHIHVPEGAVPKDGPSAGITMVTSIVSALTRRKVRKRVAMTGEITLRGLVLPVGGIKEKILAAKRAGIVEIILSETNRKDVEEIGDTYINGLTFHYVKTIVEVVERALE